MENRVNRTAVEVWIADFGLESRPHPEHDAEFEWGLLVGGQAFNGVPIFVLRSIGRLHFPRATWDAWPWEWGGWVRPPDGRG